MTFKGFSFSIEPVRETLSIICCCIYTKKCSYLKI